MADINDALQSFIDGSAAASESARRMSDAINRGLPTWQQSERHLVNWNSSVNDAAQSTRGMGRAAADASSGAKKLEKSMSQAGQKVMGVYGKLEGAMGQSGAGGLKSLIDGFGNALTGLTSSLPGMAGTIAGGITAAITGAISLAFGFVTEISDTNKKLMEEGVLFTKDLKNSMGEFKGALSGTGIDEFNELVTGAGLSAKTLMSVIAESSDSLRLLSGGTQGGVRQVVKSFKLLNDQTKEDLYALGYAPEQIMSAMADFGAAAKIAGRDLNTEQLGKSTAEYLKTQRELTALTGTSVKDAKAKQEAQKADLAFRQFLKEAGPNAAKISQLVANVPESMQPLVKTFLTGGNVIGEQMNLIKSQLGPEFENIMRDLGERSRSGADLTEQFIVDQFGSATTAAANSLDQFGETYGSGFLTTLQQTGSAFGQLVTDLGPILDYTSKVRENFKSGAGDVEGLLKGQGQLSQTIPKIEESALAISSVLYTLGATMTIALAPALQGLSDVATSGSNYVQQGLSSFGGTIGEVQKILQNAELTPEDRQKKLDEVLGKSLGGMFGGEGGGMYSNLIENLKNAIISSLETGFDRVLAKIIPFYTTTEEVKQSAEDALKKLGDVSIVEPGKVVGGGKGPTRYATSKDADKQRAFDALQNLSDQELKSLGWERIDGGLLGTDTFKKLPSQAFGDAWSPRAGGQIVRIAEAGLPEATVPLARVGGDMGVKVTGDLVDNSRTMPAMLDAINNLNQQVTSLRSLTMEQNRIMDRQLSATKTGVILSS